MQALAYIPEFVTGGNKNAETTVSSFCWLPGLCKSLISPASGFNGQNSPGGDVNPRGMMNLKVLCKPHCEGSSGHCIDACFPLEKAELPPHSALGGSQYMAWALIHTGGRINVADHVSVGPAYVPLHVWDDICTNFCTIVCNSQRLESTFK